MKDCLAGLCFVLLSTVGFSQTILIDEQLRNGSVPAGWTDFNVSMQTTAGGYARLDGTNSELITSSFNASIFSDIIVEFDVAKFGSGGDGPIDVEYSIDGGATWILLGTSPTPTDNNYLPASLSTTNLSNDMMIKFTRPNSPSSKRLRDVVISATGAACANPSWYYRSLGSSNWADGTNWEASPDGIASWIPANCPPNATAETITIQSGHTVTVTADVAIDQVVIEENASLIWTGGDLVIQDGPGEDLTIFGRFAHNINASAPYVTGAEIHVKSDGVLEVNNNSTSASHYGYSTQIFYENNAVFYWNVASGALFQTANQEYFPNAGPNETPIFRTNTPSINVGASSITRINGFFEVESNIVTWQSSGAKYFRNGIGGNGTIAQASSSGRFFMDGDTAYISGAGSLELDSDERLQTVGAVYVKLQSNYVINNGQFRITNPSTLDAQDFELSGSGTIRFNNQATLRTQHMNGIDGSIGLMDNINFVTNREQTVIFERNGLQNSGIIELPGGLGAVEIRNGAQLLLQNDLQINHLNAGYFLIDGSGSMLMLNQNTTLDIHGNRFFTLQNNGIMDNSCYEFLRFETGDNNSTAVFTGNGEQIKCYNFTTEKSTGGGCILSPNSTLYAANNLRIDYDGGNAVFTDNNNTIIVGDDVRMKGAAANFNFTGTLLLTLENSGTGNADIEPDNGVTNNTISAELNNLVINSVNPSANVRIQGSSGTNDFVIKNNFTIESMPGGTVFRPFANILYVGGNWLNQVGEAAFQHGNEVVVFNGTGSQTISCAIGEERFNEVVFDKPAGAITLGSEVVIEDEAEFANGLVFSTNTSPLTFANTATAFGYGNTSFVNGPVKKTGNQAFEFPVGKNNLLRSCAIGAPNSPSSEFRAEYFDQDPNPLYNRSLLDATLNNVSACEYWYVDRLAGSDAVTVTLTWNDLTSCGVTDLTDLRVARWSGSLWTNEGNGGTTGNTLTGSIITSGSVTNFSPFTLASETGSENPLPIELTKFSAQLIKNHVLLLWQTATEINNDYFEVERSVDGFEWEIIDRVKGAGNSNIILNYTSVDKYPKTGVSYYRLKQTDYDGTFAYSKIESINYENNKTLLKIVNSAGQIVTESYKGLVIYIYNNGDRERKYHY
jgi:hypothetical protein